MTSATLPPAETDRLDRWLWQARFFKTRSLAARVCRAGKVRVNGQRATKANTSVGSGDVLTFPQGDRIRVARVKALGIRRGPAGEAGQLYDDLTPAVAPDDRASRARGGPRPTKRDRRALDRLKDSD